MRRPIALCAALGAASMTGGCVTAAAVAVANVGMMVHQDRTVGAAIDDQTGSLTITSRLMSLDHASYRTVDVHMNEGLVLLSGSVPTEAHRLQAERIAWSVASVEAVNNELTVGPRSSLMRATHDQLITTRVRARLLADQNTKGVNFNVETYQGTVYLLGIARSEDELRRAAETASMVGGVQRVVSYVEVRARPGPPEAVLAGRGPDARLDRIDGFADADGLPSQDARFALQPDEMAPLPDRRDTGFGRDITEFEPEPPAEEDPALPPRGVPLNLASGFE